MIVNSVHHIKGRGLVVAVGDPARGIQPGWHVGSGENLWAVSGVDSSGGAGRTRRVIGLNLVAVKGDAEPKVGDVLEVRTATTSLK